jgi:hypothetical protein
MDLGPKRFGEGIISRMGKSVRRRKQVFLIEASATAGGTPPACDDPTERQQETKHPD